MSVKLGRYKYIATQGPCPEGFHIPLSSEWEGVKTIMNGLSLTTGDNWKTKLHIPFAGRRHSSSAAINNQDTDGYYWSSSPYGDSYPYRARALVFNSSSVYPQGNSSRAYGFSIRPFYNEGIAPNGGWQVLYQGTGSAGIYWHKDLGLITASSDGENWVTIADKNLGATTVYNSGDTLSEENCGYFYQWGNNYGFAYSGTITTSSTQVDASNYGPGNYYNSSTFITGNNDWSSVYNDNLWGGVDGNVWKDVESIVRLPSEYQEVGYIQLTGTQYISSFRFPVNFRFTIKAAFDATTTYYNVYDTQSISPMLWVDTSGRFEMNINYKSSEFTKNTFITVVSDATGTNNIVTIDGTQVISGTKVSTITQDTFLLHRGASDGFKGKIAYMSLEDGSTKVFELIPCYEKSSGTIGMYDLVEGKFYTNQGSGTFTKGNDVSSDMDLGEHQLDEHSMFPQGPCPDGFHVPLNSEWNKIKTFFSSCGILTGGNVCTYLKLAPDGYLSNTGTSKSEYNQYANSWSNYKGSGGTCARLSVGGPNYSPNYNTRPSTGAGLWSTVAMHIRPFKNLIVKPDSSWTTLYDGSSVATGAGIFWNSGLGLITIYDGGDYVTISDKNLGATTVWDGGTTYNEANCGKFYQWGNNYAFPFSGQSPGSTAQVDASDYGPNNPYSSSTWINTGTTDWDSSHNGDLWGGVSRTEFKQYYSFNLLNEYIGEYHECEVNTMGPCPSGFHIPTKDDWAEVKTIWTTLGGGGNDGTNFGIALKLPFAGYRKYSTSNITNQNTLGYYWSSSRKDADVAHELYLRSSSIDPRSNSYCTSGSSVRPFKNFPVIPDSSWTTLYDGSSVADFAGIFHNATDGLISISSDGTNWITIADKNLGATQVWNSGDTLSEANCGKYYQRGNNYGFPFTGTVTTSSTQVDASTYGPFTEYYNSDTFITYSGGWDSTDNANLWGGVSGNTRNCSLGGGGSLGPSTVVCDFRAGAAGETTTLNEMLVLGDFCRERSGQTGVTSGSNGTLRLQIPYTDYSGFLCLGGTEWNGAITNRGYANGVSVGGALRQNLIKKAYARISGTNDAGYPQFTNGGIAVSFTKKLVSSNWDGGNNSTSGFIFHRSNYGSRNSYRRFPIDPNVQYLVLPSTPNVGNGLTCSQYIDQGVSCFTSRVTLETRGTKPEEMHYWLIIDASGNEYDLGLCSDLGAASLFIESGDWWHAGCYKEVDEAFIEYYDGYYIDESGNITDTKPW